MRKERSDLSNGLSDLMDAEKKRGYLRFLNSFSPSLSVTYWKPASMSFASSSMVVDTFVVYSSSSFRCRSCV